VSVAPIDLRRLGPEDVSAYREIRLEALADSPHAFTSTLESEQAQPLDRFATRLADDFVLGAFSGPYLVGVAGFYIQPRPKHRHKGMLWGMYVRPDHRTAGIGRKLVEAIIEHVRQHVELLQLVVVADNMPARRLYTNLGFIEYGIERHATKYHGQYHDDVLMALPLVVDSAAEASRAPTEEISAEEVSA
jgi:ribosomal protein S18 acetylase RimI-like enzyme